MTNPIRIVLVDFLHTSSIIVELFLYPGVNKEMGHYYKLIGVAT